MHSTSLTLSYSPLLWNVMTDVIGVLLGKNIRVILESEIKKQTQVIHMYHFIDQFSQQYFKYPTKQSVLQAESLLTMRKWSNFTRLCQSIDAPVFSSLNNSQVNQICLGDGICVGSTIFYFNQFFQNFSPLSASFMQVGSPLYLDIETNVKIYPFILDEQSVEKKTESLRFLQASYKIAYALKQAESLEFVSNKVLEKYNLEIVRRFPDLQTSGKRSFSIKELLPELKKLAALQEKNKGYLMGLGGIEHHSLALYLYPPFHFVDPSRGIMIGEKLEDLALFLAAYLTEKFPDCHSFALLELIPIKLKT